MPVPEPVAFTIFGIDIMWYAVLITSGMIIATVICCVRAPKHDLTSDQIINFVIICIPAAIIGARLYYVVFNWEFYASDIKKILNIRGGGLAIHGGLIFAFVAVCILCAVWKLMASERPRSCRAVYSDRAGDRTMGKLFQLGGAWRPDGSAVGDNGERTVRAPDVPV